MDNENRNEIDDEKTIDGQIISEQTVDSETSGTKSATSEQQAENNNAYTGRQQQYDGNGYNRQPYNNNPYNNYNGTNNKKNNGKTVAIIACVIGIIAVLGISCALVIGMISYIDKHVTKQSSTDSVTEKTEDATQITSQPISTTAPVSVAEAEKNVYSAIDVSGMVEEVMPSVVSIVSTTSVDGYSIFGEKYKQQYDASGTGFIVGQNDSELLLATNNHVVENATAVQVTFVNDETAEAIVKGTDPKADLAVIAVKLEDITDKTMDSIKIAVLGDSDALKVGQAAIAIGNAQGMGQSVTTGCISAKDRELTLQDNTNGGSKTMKFIQTDAAINGGNSGGPLLDINGNVVGISTAKITDTQVEGMCFAIPISSAKPIINELMNRETLTEDEKGYLGVAFQNISSEAVSMYGVPDGVYVAQVTRKSPAEKAGIKEGDIITSIDSFNVNSKDSAAEKIQSNKAGTEITIVLYRQNSSKNGYDEITVKVKLASAKELGIDTGKSSGNSGAGSDRQDSGNDGNDSDEENGYRSGRSDDWFEEIFPW